MEQKFADRIAVVTGAAAGIGKAVALRLAREGADVAIVDVDEKGSRTTAEEIEAIGRRAIGVPTDLSRVEQIRGMVDEVTRQFGRIDILVAAAGVVKSTPFLEVTEEEWDRVIDVNQKGTAFCIQAVARQMWRQVPDDVKERGKAERSFGKIVTFSSISGRRGRAYQLHYAASKAAIISITQSAALALAPYNINVNAVAPSVVYTAMWDHNVEDKRRITGVDAQTESEQFIARVPLGRAGTLDDMTAAVSFLCSPESDYVTGQTLNVDGGFEMN